MSQKSYLRQDKELIRRVGMWEWHMTSHHLIPHCHQQSQNRASLVAFLEHVLPRSFPRPRMSVWAKVPAPVLATGVYNSVHHHIVLMRGRGDNRFVLAHEIAHALTLNEIGETIDCHGGEWVECYSRLLVDYLEVPRLHLAECLRWNGLL